MRIYRDNSYSIGNTPLVSLGRIGLGMKANLIGKVEGRNPAYSVKCRLGAALIWDAEKRGTLKPGGTIVEPTSGNTGIALAFVAAARGYRLILTMPDTMSMERRNMLKAYGAELVLTDGAKGMPHAIQQAEAIAAEDPSHYIPQQFKNPANPDIHLRTTGPEIWRDTDGKVDVVVAGVGTGGTITGVAKYLKDVRGGAVEIVAVEPETSPVLSGGKPGPNKIQGIGAGFVPEIVDMDYIDRVEQVSYDEAVEYARRLTQEEGIISGISCGAATAVAARLAADDAYENKNIVAILPDSGERYLSTALYSLS